jgi:two-component system, sensor histidine kinase and response regulator
MANISTLRVLLIEKDPSESERISTLLESANHAVFPLTCLEEAAEALEIQRFDVVLLHSGVSNGELKSFTAKLRQLEGKQRSSAKAPILSFSDGAPDPSGWMESHEADIDGYLSESFDPAAFASAVENLAGSLVLAGSAFQGAETRELPHFDPDGFQEQMGYDCDLAVEIIDLFLAECVDQVRDMRQMLAANNLPMLSRIAHTMKGSLGSLHALRSRLQAEELELAAKRGERDVCGPLLDKLVGGLEALRPELLHLRGALGSGL